MTGGKWFSSPTTCQRSASAGIHAKTPNQNFGNEGLMRGRKPDLQIIAGREGPFAVPKPQAASKRSTKVLDDNALQCPPSLRGRERRAWATLIAPCWWLQKSDLIKAEMLVRLYAEWQRSRDMPAARLSVLRHLSTDIFESSRRVKGAVVAPKSYADRYRSGES
jgi:hypothetical protein